MDDEVLQFVRNARGAHLSAKEVGKAVDRTRYREEPNWARAILEQLAGRQAIQKDNDSRYFYEPSDA